MTAPSVCRRDATVVRYRTGFRRWRAVCACGWSEWGGKEQAYRMAKAHNAGFAA
jgi:hypothetical protein